jgi:hypothetical protein
VERTEDPTETWRFLHRTQVDDHTYELDILYGANSSSLDRLQSLEGQLDGLVVPFAITSKVNFALACDRHEMAAKVLEKQTSLPTLVIAIDYEKVERQISDDEGRDFALGITARYVDWDPTTNEPDAADELLHILIRDIMVAKADNDPLPDDWVRSDGGRKSPFFGTDSGDRNRLQKKQRPTLAPFPAGVGKPRDRTSRMSGSKRDSHGQQNPRRSTFEKLKRILCFGFLDEPTLYKPMPTAPPRVDMSRDEWVQMYGTFPTISPTTDTKQ